MSLEDIREKKHGKGVYIIIGMLLVGMAGFGTGQFGTGGNASAQVIMKTDHAEITLNEYENALRTIQQNNPNLDATQARTIAVAGLKERLALADYISRYPFAASNKQIDEAITSDRAFYDNGKFSEEAFHRLVRTSPEAYRRGLSRILAMRDFQQAIASTSVISDAELQPYLELQNLSRNISVAKIPASGFSATATEQETQKYYDDNANQFMTDEKYDIEYIDFDPAAMANAATVSDEQVNAALAPPREASYYLFKDAASAKAAAEQVVAGKNIQSVVAGLGDSVEDNGELGELTAVAGSDAVIPQAAIDAIFALNNVGEVTAPITVDGGVYLFELTNKTNVVASEQDKIAAQKKLQAQLVAPQVAEMSEKLNKAVFESGAPSLQTITEATGLAVQQSGLVSENSQQGLMALPEMLNAINQSDKTVGQLQEPVTIGDRVIIYRFSEVQKPTQKPFADVKAQAEQLLIAEKIKQQMSEAAKKLIENTKTAGLSAAATQLGYASQTYNDFTGQVSEGGLLDPIAAILIAQTSPKLGNDKASDIASPLGDSYVYVTDSVSLEQTDTDEAMKKQLTEQLKMRTGVMQLGAFLQSITERGAITDNSASLLQQQ